MRRMVPVILVLGVVVGCAGDPQKDKPIDPSLAQVTIEVKGMS